MKRSLTLAVASVLLAAPAFGGVLHTAPASALFTEASLACGFRNVSSTPRDVTVELLDAGNVVKGHTFEDVSPGKQFSNGAYQNEPVASCRFTFSGSTKYIPGGRGVHQGWRAGDRDPGRVSPAGSFRQAGPSRWSGLPFDDLRPQAPLMLLNRECGWHTQLVELRGRHLLLAELRGQERIHLAEWQGVVLGAEAHEGVGRQLTLAILLRRDAEPVRPARIDIDGQIGHELIGDADALRRRALHVVEPVALEVLAREGREEPVRPFEAGRNRATGADVHRVGAELRDGRTPSPS